MIRLACCAVGATLRAAELASSAASRLPLYGRIEGIVLDTLLGPVEEFEYVYSTTPTGPPTTS